MRDNAKKRNTMFNIVFSALFLALAYLIPLFMGQVQSINAMFCPMHIPIFLCGAICGWQWGLVVGIVAPISRSLILGMPLFFPTAVCMAFELATYGLVFGLIYKLLPKKIVNMYISLLVAMLLGRVARGIAEFSCMGLSGKTFELSVFLNGVVLYSVPGIILQFLLVPLIVVFAERLKTRT